MGPGQRDEPGKMIDPSPSTIDRNLRLGAGYQLQESGYWFQYPAGSRRIARKPHCAAWAWAHAASRTTAPCAPVTWPPGRRNIRPAAALICCGRCCKAISSPTAGGMKKSKKRSTFASPARHAKASAQSMWTWRPGKPNFLAHHYQDRTHPLQHYLFGFMDRLARPLADCARAG